MALSNLLKMGAFIRIADSIYDMDMVNRSIVGSFDSVKRDILNPIHHKRNYKKPDIYEEYARIEERIKSGTY